MMKSKGIILLTTIGLVLSALTGCGSKNEGSETTTNQVSATQDITGATKMQTEATMDTGNSKMDLLDTAMKLQGLFSDNIEYKGCISYFEENPEKAFEWSYTENYVVESDLLVVKRTGGLDNIGIDISSWKDGDFATVMINLNEYCPMYCDEQRCPEGTLNKDNFDDYVSTGHIYTFKAYSGRTEYDGSASEETVCEIDLLSPAYVTLSINKRGFNLTPLLYIEEDDIFLAHAYDKDNGLMLPAIYSDGYNCNDILGQKYVVEIKVNGEVIDYNGNSEQLFAKYDADRNNVEEWQKEGRYYVHADGSSCKRLGFYYNVAEVESREYVEWCGVALYDASKCSGCTNKIELAGKEITSVDSEAIFEELKAAGGYRMTVKRGDGVIQLYGPTVDDDIYMKLISYLMDYDKKYGTTLFDEVIVNRKLQYK